jgi:hypothetical protein
MGARVVDSPDDVSGLVGWWDFSDATTMFTDDGVTPVSLDGALIYRINDKSASGANLTQATEAERPSYETNLQNSLSGANFSTAAITGTLTQAQPATVILVAKKASTSSTGVFFSGNSAADFHLYSNITTGVFGGYCGVNGLVGSTDQTGAWHVFTYIINGATSSIFVDGTSYDTGDAGTNTINAPRLGRDRSATNPYDGDMGEVLIYNGALSAGDRDTVETLLQTKWGTP